MKRRDVLQMMLMAPALGRMPALAASVSNTQGGFAASGCLSMNEESQKAVKQKMVLIGAGSAMFTQGIVIDWMKGRPEGEWEIALVDINPVILEATEKLVRRYMMASKSPAKIIAAVDRREVLPGATIVICTIGVGSRRAWEQDVFVPRRFGINQPVGDSVMPGGVSRAMRMIPPMVDIAKDAERLCPKARFINYSNPMTAIVRALWRTTSVCPLGLCMGTEETLRFLANVAGVPQNTISARWAGLNHLTWILDFRSGGKDLWPKIRAKVEELRRNGIDRGSWASPFGQSQDAGKLTFPFSWELLDEYGAFPAPMDRHVTEFFPERFPNGRYYGSILGVDAYSFEGTIARGDKIYDDTISLAKESGPMDPRLLESTEGEHMQTMDILDSFYHDRRRLYSANVPNNGAVSNLPKDSILELPAIAGQEGMVPIPMGEVPLPIASVLLRRLGAVEATVEAALTGNRKLMVEALILDGGVSDYGAAGRLTDELLKAQAEHLPQFR